jgi:hypothetical protein
MRLRLPKEHGSWGMFFIPAVLGLLAARRWNVEALLFVVAGVGLFLSREPFIEWWRLWRRGQNTAGARMWLVLYGSISAIAGLVLAIGYGRPALIPLAAAAGAIVAWHADVTMRGLGRSLAAQLLSVLAASLAAPAAFYAVTGILNASGLLLWALAAAYFGSSVFYVKMRVTEAHARHPDMADVARRSCAVYHVGLFATLAMLPPLAALAYVPVIVRAAVRIIRPTRELNLKQIGWSEVVYSIVFLTLIAYSV